MSNEARGQVPFNGEAVGTGATETGAFDASVFKAAMRKVAGTVSVIGTSDADELYGMTATAMCSVSADPPTILIVVNRAARTHPHIDRKKAFTVNVLSTAQRSTADVFAAKGADQFSDVDHRRLSDGCPVIIGATAYLHCSVVEQFDVGTHTIFVGAVIDAGVAGHEPLVYQDAHYGRVVRHPGHGAQPVAQRSRRP